MVQAPAPLVNDQSDGEVVIAFRFAAATNATTKGVLVAHLYMMLVSAAGEPVPGFSLLQQLAVCMGCMRRELHGMASVLHGMNTGAWLRRLRARQRPGSLHGLTS